MSWPQIAQALKEKRHEICLTGKAFSEHLAQHGVDADLFKIKSLNYLAIHNTTLDAIDKDIALLEGLQTLSLHSNKIATVDGNHLEQLDKLRVLDLSHNSIVSFDITLNALEHLTTINLSNNQLDAFPPVDKCIRLQVIDVSHNKLKHFPTLCNPALVALSDVRLGNNLIAEIPAEIDQLPSLKSLDVSSNQLTVVPYNLINCNKLKELNIKENPVKDRRLFKLIDQCRTKQVLDYLKQHAPVQESAKDGKRKGKNKGQASAAQSAVETADANDNNLKLHLKYASSEDDALKIVITEDVKAVRQNIVCCLLHGLQFNEAIFRKFIQLQNKLHETMCEKRTTATIATHDAQVLTGGKLIYTAMKPTELKIRPLNAPAHMSGAKLFDKLQQEADSLRREKKRNVYSGIHKYLYLLEGKPVYPCLLREDTTGRQEVISFPPITNSDVSKVTTATVSILLEVTSHTNAPLTRRIADVCLQEICLLMGSETTAGPLCVEQLRVVDGDGNLKSVYPSKTDLLELNGVTVIRD